MADLKSIASAAIMKRLNEPGDARCLLDGIDISRPEADMLAESVLAALREAGALDELDWQLREVRTKTRRLVLEEAAVERVARALCKAQFYDIEPDMYESEEAFFAGERPDEWKHFGDTDFMALARAALQALKDSQ
jgi:hypothetical protein